MPQIEFILDKGFEILYLTEYVDEFALQMLGEYDGKGNLYAEYESFTYLPLAEY